MGDPDRPLICPHDNVYTADDELPYTAPPGWLRCIVLLTLLAGCVGVWCGVVYGATRLAAWFWP